ncbi:MAG: sulfotransferase [Planctomycetaceae bacterium]
MLTAPYCRYILLSHGRTGSTILTRMLRDHSRIVDYQELFNVDFQAEFRRGSDRTQSLRYWLETLDQRKLRRRPILANLGTASESQILDEFVWHNDYAEQIRAVGFKVLHYQMKVNGAFPKLSEQLQERLPGLRVVVLTRCNLLRQHLSHVMAHRVKQWHISDSSQRRPRPPVRFTPQELVHAFEYVQQTEQELLELGRIAEDVLHVTYEQLVETFDGHWRKLQRFLDVPEEPLPELRLVKIEHRTLREAIVNYDELKAHFHGTTWESHFDE